MDDKHPKPKTVKINKVGDADCTVVVSCGELMYEALHGFLSKQRAPILSNTQAAVAKYNPCSSNWNSKWHQPAAAEYNVEQTDTNN